MFSFLNKPYPYFPFSFRDVRINFLIGLFIFLFLLLFQPFGLSEWKTDREMLKLSGFGAVSFVTPLLFKLLCMLCFKTERWPDSWAVWKEILAIVTVIVLIAFGNLLFGYSIGLAAFHFRPFMYALLATALVGCFPVTLSVVLKYNRFLTLNEEDAGKMEAELKKRESRPAAADNTQLIFTAENEKDKLGMFPDQLLYIESADNYSNVVFMQGELKNRELIRSSLKRLESQVSNTYIIRCHRSFIVNLKAISHIEGNAQGYRISFKQVSDSIPVSRNYGKEILDRLKALK